MLNGTMTRSPGLTFCTDEPTWSMTPMNSWPKVMPTRVSGIIPWYRCRSEPQMAARVTRTMASLGCSIAGTSFSSVRTLYGPRYTIARIRCLRRASVRLGVRAVPTEDAAATTPRCWRRPRVPATRSWVGVTHRSDERPRKGSSVTTKVNESIQVDVPVRVAYDQWTQFEEFPRFMGGVSQVTQLSDTLLHWVAEIAGVRREWDAAIIQQVPDERIAWAATEGATNAGAVSFVPVGAEATTVTLELEYEPEGVVEKAGDALNLVQRQVTGDLERFKGYVESRGAETGGWRGAVNEDLPVGTPGAQDASMTRGDSGKAGVSGKAVAAGAAAGVGGGGPGHGAG